MFKIKRVVCRIYDPPRGQMYRELGIQTVVPTTVGAKLIRDTLMQAPWDPVHTFDFGKVTSLSATVDAGSAGKSIGEIERPGRIRVAAIRRGGSGVQVASNDLVLQEGDQINAIVAPEAISEFAGMFTGCSPEAVNA
jgi:trk system potassium uptake protein TrkA